jgi:hypothetical protein
MASHAFTLEFGHATPSGLSRMGSFCDLCKTTCPVNV